MGFGLNWTGAAAGYNAYKDELRQQAEDDRKAAADAALAQERAFAEETRSRQRYDWSEADRVRNNFRRDMANGPAAATPPDAGAAPVAPTPAASTDTRAPSADGAPPADGSVQTYPGADPTSGITPTAKAADLTPAPLDAEVAGAPPQVAVADNIAATAPAAPAPAPAATASAAVQPAPVDASLAGAPPQPIATAAPAAAAPATAAPTAQAPVVSPAATPAGDVPGLTEPTGIPKPRALGSVLDRQRYALEQAAARGDVSLQAYGQGRELLNKMRSEGISQALEAFSRGDYQGGIDAYNSNGVYNGARLDPNRPPQDAITTLPDGSKMPTKLVTIVNQDGSRVVIDTTADRYKAMSLETQLNLMDKGADREVKAATAKAQQTHADAAMKQADTMEGYRKDQAKNMQEARRLEEQANMVKMLTAGGKNASRMDDKEFKETMDLNQNLYSFTGEDGKSVEVPEAKSLYGNMMKRFGSADASYQVMAMLRKESAQAATDPKTGQVDPAKFLLWFKTKVAAADEQMRQNTGPAKPGAAAPAGQAGTPAAGQPPTAKKAPSNPAIPDPPAQKVWIGNDYVANPAYAEWQRKFQAAWDAQNKAFTNRMDWLGTRSPL